ncbi:hypothetical protein SAMN05421827_12423 [Pedobacter terrae]|uniref:Uncharacterized protein n=1 Tax=Pedobacter terrae TaxID=405671 RepID=A0A1G7ZZP8_9SPHI|nr:hypothetical protein SAMN05421827_11790 [Pedobacter terrae]SDH42267.1 hypothetical protein SAMN05421827_12423 [Pedobacter terrae]
MAYIAGLLDCFIANSTQLKYFIVGCQQYNNPTIKQSFKTNPILGLSKSPLLLFRVEDLYLPGGLQKYF